jgi:glycine/D-amino acid oxidase-like deaminating enzyme
VTTTSYWLAETGTPFGPQTTSGPVDVIVVGAGVTGCSCALSLAKRGVRVRVHEAREIAGGASGRNGGFALRGGAAGYVRARETMGPKPARMLWELSERALDAIEALAGDELRRVGCIRLAADAAERDALEHELEALLEDGFAVDWLESLPAPLDRLFHGALLHPGDGALHPARWVRRLATTAMDAGAEVAEHSRAELDALEAEVVVVATDGSTARLLPELERLVLPVRGQMLATAPIAERLFERPHYARHGFDYWQQLADGRLVVGGKRDVSLEAEYTDIEETTPVVQERLEALVVELLGALPPITHRWSGIWGETPDSLPLAGRMPGRSGVWIAGGYSGHGNVLGFACGEMVGRAIAGEHVPELALFDPARFVPAERPERNRVGLG